MAYVGERGFKDVVAGSGLTEVLTLTSSCSAGNFVLLVVVCRVTAGTAFAVTDSRGNTWTVDVKPTGSTNFVAICRTQQNTATLVSSDTITCTWTTNAPGNVRKIICEEFSEIAASPFDQSATSTVGTGGTTFAVGPSGTTTQASELVVAAYCLDAGQFPAITGDADYLSFTTSEIEAGNPADALRKTLYAQYRYVATTGTQSHGGSAVSTINSYQGALATYKTSSAPPAGRRGDILVLGVG